MIPARNSRSPSLIVRMRRNRSARSAYRAWSSNGGHHFLLQVGDPSGDRAQDRFMRPGQRGEQGVRQLGRRSRGQPSRREALAQLVGVVPRLVVGDLCAVGPVHGDQDVVAHERRQLQEVNVAGSAAQQRAVGHDEPGVGVAVERR
jgi:hypothetical protein